MTAIPAPWNDAPPAEDTTGPLVSAEIEQALLACLLADPRGYDQAVEMVGPEHFADPLNGLIFATVGRLIERGDQPSAVAISQAIAGDADFLQAGGRGYLAKLVSLGGLLSQARPYAETVRDLAQRRAIVRALGEAQADALAYEMDRPAKAVVDDIESALDHIAGEGEEARIGTAHQAASEALQQAEAAWRSGGQLQGVPTGLANLDALTGGLRASQLILLAGRPSMGKTALAANIAESAARNEYPVLFFSLEMSRQELGVRLLARPTGIATDRITQGAFEEPDFEQLFHATGNLHDLPLTIDDTPALTIGQMRARARRHKRRHGLGLIVVDYLQLARPDRERKGDNRTSDVTAVSGGLKALAKDMEVPVLALSQLSRQCELRDDKRPQLADLRDSGAIEQDADAVIFCYREEYYLSRDPEPRKRASEDEAQFSRRVAEYHQRLNNVRGLAELIVAKQRNGPAPATRRFRFNGKTCAFEDIA